MSGSAELFAPLVAAVRSRRDDASAVAYEVGANAASRGIPLDEVLDRVERAYDGGPPVFESVRAAAVAWADRAMLHAIDVGCEDPLTSLSTVQHARTRLADVYRIGERDGRPACLTHALVVIETPHVEGNALEVSLQAVEIAQMLRDLFDGDETLTRLSARRFAVLARHENVDAVQLHLLARLLERIVPGSPQPRIWTERLPTDAADLPHVLAALSH